MRLHVVLVASALAESVRQQGDMGVMRRRGVRGLQWQLSKKKKKRGPKFDYEVNFNSICIAELNRRAELSGALGQSDFAGFLFDYCSRSPVVGPSCLIDDGEMPFDSFPLDIQLVFASSACPLFLRYKKIECLEDLLSQGKEIQYQEEIEELCEQVSELLESTKILVNSTSTSPPSQRPMFLPITVPLDPINNDITLATMPPTTSPSTSPVVVSPNVTQTNSPSQYAAPVQQPEGLELSSESNASSTAGQPIDGYQNWIENRTGLVAGVILAVAVLILLVTTFTVRKYREKAVHDSGDIDMDGDVSVPSEQSGIYADTDAPDGEGSSSGGPEQEIEFYKEVTVTRPDSEHKPERKRKRGCPELEEYDDIYKDRRNQDRYLLQPLEILHNSSVDEEDIQENLNPDPLSPIRAHTLIKEGSESDCIAGKIAQRAAEKHVGGSRSMDELRTSPSAGPCHVPDVPRKQNKAIADRTVMLLYRGDPKKVEATSRSCEGTGYQASDCTKTFSSPAVGERQEHSFLQEKSDAKLIEPTSPDIPIQGMPSDDDVSSEFDESIDCVEDTEESDHTSSDDPESPFLNPVDDFGVTSDVSDDWTEETVSAAECDQSSVEDDDGSVNCNDRLWKPEQGANAHDALNDDLRNTVESSDSQMSGSGKHVLTGATPVASDDGGNLRNRTVKEMIAAINGSGTCTTTS